MTELENDLSKQPVPESSLPKPQRIRFWDRASISGLAMALSMLGIIGGTSYSFNNEPRRLSPRAESYLDTKAELERIGKVSYNINWKNADNVKLEITKMEELQNKLDNTSQSVVDEVRHYSNISFKHNLGHYISLGGALGFGLLLNRGRGNKSPSTSSTESK